MMEGPGSLIFTGCCFRCDSISRADNVRDGREEPKLSYYKPQIIGAETNRIETNTAKNQHC